MIYQKNKKNKKINVQSTFIIFCVVFAFLFFLANFENAKIKPAKAAKDAVAIRIIPNPKHQSPSSWYKEQGFTGSPQNTVVDGYEAIMDGRTVYANVANIDGGVLYTNIYLISYNQAPSQGTADFFSRLVLNWKFNTNEVWEGTCNDNVDIVCVKDVDCGFDDYCTGKKAQIIRDVKRLSDLYEINNAIAVFHDKNGLFPSIKSGSYLRTITISNWPSWKKVLSQTIGLNVPVDPVNRLGPCIDGVSGLVDERFHEVTCWDNDVHAFADGDLGDSAFNLPDGSKTYVYQSFEDGIRYELCAVMESGYVTGLVNGACDGSSTFEHEDVHGNRPPIFVGSSGEGESPAGREYIHYVKAIDPDGDELTWDIDTSGEIWTGWSSPPELQDIPPIDEKRVFASQIGTSGDYTYTVIVRDGRGGEARRDITVRAVNMNLPIITRVVSEGGVVLYDVDADLTGVFNVGDIVIGNSMNLRIEGYEADSQYPLSFEFNGFSVVAEEMADFADTTLIQSATILEDDTGLYLIDLRAYDAYRGRSRNAVSFNVTIINNPPAIVSVPVTTVEGCTDYSYQVVAVDPDGHEIGYLFANNTDLPFSGSLVIDPLTGLCQGTPIVAASADYDIDLSARDEYYAETNVPYSAEDVQSFVLTLTDENYAVNNISDRSIYNDPGVGATYYRPITYFETYGSTADYPDDVIWSGTGLPAGFSIVPTTGNVNWTPDASQDGSTYQIDVDARNQCNVLREESYDLTVLQNEWCGDDIIQGAFTERCEVTDLDDETCLTFGYDGGVLNCSLCDFDFGTCCIADCGSRNCDISPNGCASCGDPRNIDCTDGDATCDPLYQSCSGDPGDSDGCECYLNPGQFEYCYGRPVDANIKLLLQGYQFVDSSSFGHAINNNGVVATNATTFSGFGRSMRFNGGDDNLRVNDSNDWNMINGDFTVDALLRLDTIGQNQVIAYQGNGSAPDWTFFYDRNEGLSFCARPSGSESWFNDCNDLVGTTTGWAINTWHHVAVVREGDTWDIYRDGVSMANITETRTNMPNIARRLYIGADSDNNRNIVGYIDEFRISKGRALWTSSAGPGMVFYNGAGAACTWFPSSWSCI